MCDRSKIGKVQGEGGEQKKEHVNADFDTTPPANKKTPNCLVSHHTAREKKNYSGEPPLSTILCQPVFSINEGAAILVAC